jgi:hypothetical protein
VGSCEDGDESLGTMKVGNFYSSLVTISFSKRTLFHTAVDKLYLDPAQKWSF